MELILQNGDYVPDGIGGERRAAGKEELLARALYRLSARRSSFPFLPTLGSELYRLGGEKASRRETAARQYVTEALAEETVLTVEDVTLTEGADGILYVHVALRSGEESIDLTLTAGGA